jgi:hypothetical protein
MRTSIRRYVGAHFFRKDGNTEIRVQIPYFTRLD